MGNDNSTPNRRAGEIAGADVRAARTVPPGGVEDRGHVRDDGTELGQHPGDLERPDAGAARLGGSGLDLPSDEVHLWFLFDSDGVETECLNSYTASISKSERMEMGKLLFPKNRRQFLLARVLVRTVLSVYFPRVRPDEWTFERSPSGRPYLAEPLKKVPDFNISHTDGLVVIGVSAKGNIGVDAEYLDRGRCLVENAGMFLSLDEEREMESLPVRVRLRRAYQLWTLKEAFLKACEAGCPAPAKALEFSWSAHEERIDLRIEGRCRELHGWEFWQFAPDDSHEVAIALRRDERPDRPVSLRLLSIDPFRKCEEPSLSDRTPWRDEPLVVSWPR